ncbi:MAG: hypothetical protein ACJ8BW_34065 [Ktedonobacteraceae bacterium]
MTQASDRKPLSTHRRSTRGVRNRPVLITDTTSENNEYVAEDATAIGEENSPEEQPSTPAAAPTKSFGSRLPKFFSTVGKSEQTQENQEDIAAKARLARATRGKVSSPSTEVTKEEKSETRKPAARPTTAARPGSSGSLFKTRYLIGIGIYLIGANFVGIFETSFFQSRGLDTVLTRFPLFGSQVVIRTSTLAYLATLVILLVLLARFDLIPRSFSAMSGQSAASRNARNGSSKSRSDTTEGARSAPPTLKQGVKGANDDLYQQYRANQRRDRKK